MAIPVLAFVPKCPMCWLAYLAFAEGFALSTSGLLAGLVFLLAAAAGIALFARHRSRTEA